MVILSMDFIIPRIAFHLMLKGRNGALDMQRVEAFFDPDYTRQLADLPGLRWKLWGISPDGRHGSGYYLFETRADAEVRERWAKKFYWRKGMLFLKTRIYDVMEESSRITRCPIDLPPNPSCTPEVEAKLFDYHPDNPIKTVMKHLRKA